MAPTADDGQPRQRLVILDTLRGLAILGILIVNIQMFGLYGVLQLNPTALGEPAWPDRLAWLFVHVAAERKFITLLTVLFGAGLALTAARARTDDRGFTELYRRRLIWLMIIGLLHGYVIWPGDILFAYGLCGLLALHLRHLPARRMLVLALGLFAVPGFIGLAVAGLSVVPSLEEAFRIAAFYWEPPTFVVLVERAVRQANWGAQLWYRLGEASQIQLMALWSERLWRCLALMLVGMAAVRLDFWTRLQDVHVQRYAFGLALGLGVPLIVLGVWLNETRGWDMLFAQFVGRQFNYWASPLVTLGWMALVTRLMRLGAADWLMRRLSEVGRLALSNYLLQSLVCTWIFYGHGLGWFGRLDRIELLGVVVAIWGLQITLTHLWLRSFAVGPVEWIWRRASEYRFWTRVRYA